MSESRKKYRDKIYASYKDDLDERLVTGSYAKERKLISKYIRRNYLKHLPTDKDAKILDLGCGQGHYVYCLQRMGYKNVIGVDYSYTNVKFGKSQGIKIVQGDVLEHLKLNENEYDAILFNDVIEHFDKDEIVDIVEALYRSLRTGGVCITKTDNEANPFTGVSGRYMDFTHEIGFVSLSLEQVFRIADFSSVKVVGADIYVFGIIGFFIKIISKVVYFIFFLLNCMAGRWSVRIFEKCIICVAKK